MSRPVALPSRPTAHRYNKQLFDTAEFADCTILTANGRCFSAHRNILSPRCDFFRCCFAGRFEESVSRVVEMHDDHPTAVEGMLWYIYTLDYPAHLRQQYPPALEGLHVDWCQSPAGRDSGFEHADKDRDDTLEPGASGRWPGECDHADWKFDLVMFTIADKYGLTSLREMASQALIERVDTIPPEPETTTMPSRPHLAHLSSLLGELYRTEHVSPACTSLRTDILVAACGLIVINIKSQPISHLFSHTPCFAVEFAQVLAKQYAELKAKAKARTNAIEEDKAGTALPHPSPLHHVPMNEDSDSDGL